MSIPTYARAAFFMVFTLCLFGVGCSSPQAVQETRPIRIGSFLPLTGDLAVIGQDIQRGAELAKADLKAYQAPPVEYISEDDQFKPSVAIQAANKLLSVDRVDAVFTATVQEAKPVFSSFEQKMQPLLVAWDSNRFLKEAKGPIYSIGFSTEGTAQILAEYAYRDLQLRNVAVLRHEDEWSELTAGSFEEAFGQLGGKVVLSEKRPVGDKDYRTFLTKAKTAKIDGVFFPLVPPANAILLKQAQELGMNVKMMTGDGLLKDEIKEAGMAAENLFFTGVFAQQADYITEKYKERYQTDPVDPAYVGFGYDAMMVLVQSVTTARTKSISVEEALKTAEFNGIGSQIKMNGTRFSERLERVYQVKSAKPELVKE